MLSVWSLSLFGAGLLAAPSVLFEGEQSCPSPEAITRELERIVVAPEGSEPKDTALVLVEGPELRVVLVARDGRLLGERKLPADATCDERALSVAVVLGAWIATEHPEYLGSLPEPRRATPEVPTAAPPPSPPPLPTAAPATPPSTPSPPPHAQPTAAPIRTEPAWRMQPSLAAGVELSDAGLVPAMDVSVRYAPETSGFGAAAFLLIAGAEERALGNGRVSSFRWPLGVGALARLAPGSVAFELDAGPMLGLIHLEGRGFPTNDATTDVQGGIHAGLVVGASSGRFRPFGGARLLTWLGTVTASADLPDAEVDLPVFEGVFLAGIRVAP